MELSKTVWVRYTGGKRGIELHIKDGLPNASQWLRPYPGGIYIVSREWWERTKGTWQGVLAEVEENDRTQGGE